jgi:hypothetical protein
LERVTIDTQQRPFVEPSECRSVAVRIGFVGADARAGALGARRADQFTPVNDERRRGYRD